VSEIMFDKRLRVVFKGAGEMATAAARRLHLAGFGVIMTELPQPLCVRRMVSYAECVFSGTTEVEGTRAEAVRAVEAIEDILGRGSIAVIVAPKGDIIPALNPAVLVDARLLKVRTETRLSDAPAVIGLGPGFVAGQDVHAVVETNRGHNLGRAIYQGEAEPDTGIPAPVGGYTEERVLRAPASGVFAPLRNIGDQVVTGEVVARLDGQPVTARIGGVIRGLVHEGVMVPAGLKVGDIDPRNVREYCYTISDKANAIAGGVLEASFRLLRQKGWLLDFPFLA
jgi:xanthine dehydrogenase accessory factor